MVRVPAVPADAAGRARCVPLEQKQARRAPLCAVEGSGACAVAARCLARVWGASSRRAAATRASPRLT